MLEHIDKKKPLWDRFIRLGDRIGEGDLDASESKWMNREYKQLSRALIPELKLKDKKVRADKSKRIDEQMVNLLQTKLCACGGKLKQSRKGSVICYCEDCKSRYKASSKKRNN